MFLHGQIFEFPKFFFCLVNIPFNVNVKAACSVTHPLLMLR